MAFCAYRYLERRLGKNCADLIGKFNMTISRNECFRRRKRVIKSIENLGHFMTNINNIKNVQCFYQNGQLNQIICQVGWTIFILSDKIDRDIFRMIKKLMLIKRDRDEHIRGRYLYSLQRM